MYKNRLNYSQKSGKSGKKKSNFGDIFKGKNDSYIIIKIHEVLI